MYAIAANCDNVLGFLKEVVVKAPMMVAKPLSLREDKRERG